MDITINYSDLVKILQKSPEKMATIVQPLEIDPQSFSNSVRHGLLRVYAMQVNFTSVHFS